jgi:polyribonucleotide nucleotidyltransferase
MDAGVPMTKPVAGISVGLFTAEDKAELVTDILGAEDHCGDMDFKVSGTRDGITGFQVDLKIRGLAWDLVEGAFAWPKTARHQILDSWQGVIAEPRAELSPYAPRITVRKINPEKIGALIGPGGKNIRRITDTTGAKIDIEDDGTVMIFAVDKNGDGRGGARGQPGRGRSRSRQALPGHGHRHQGIRRLRRNPARQGRPGAHQRDGQLPRQVASRTSARSAT